MQKDTNLLWVTRLGKIFNNFAILGGVLLFFIAAAPFLTLLYLIIAVAAMFIYFFVWLCSGGTLEWDFTKMFETEFFSSMSSYMSTAFPYIFGITSAVAVISVILLVLDKGQKHPVRITFATLAVVVGIIALLLQILVSGGAVQ